VLVKPQWLLDRELEWAALERFVERRGRLAVVYGPRRVGKSFLIDALCGSVGGRRYQAIPGVSATQLADFGRELGGWIGAGPLLLDGWADAIERLSRVPAPLVAIDELPYLTEESPELAGVLQRYADAGDGPSLILAGSAMSVMSDLIASQAPLYRRAGAIVVPAPFGGAHLSALWGTTDPLGALWVDAALGGRPGYRPLVASPGKDLDAWMTDELMAPGSPLLDAAEADLAEIPDPVALRGVYRAVIAAIAAGERTFSSISRVAGLPSGALSRPLAALQRAGLVERVPDPLRARRDRYELADPHLRFWLAVIAPNRSLLQAGRAKEVWDRLGGTSWRSQVLGPRWEAVVRAHLAGGAVPGVGVVDAVGVSMVSDRELRRAHEVDVVALRAGRVVALGEAKLRALGGDDLERLLRIREIMRVPDAMIVLASATGVTLPRDAPSDVVTIEPADVYC
jgi:DNA-binding transcriptional ArsR family regulator